MSSINQYSPEISKLWWTTTHQEQNPSTTTNTIYTSWQPPQQSGFNLNNMEDEEEDDNDMVRSPEREEEEEEKEAMFEKALTPSDVGKLNRLVIPKQHAEKYFPLDNSEENNKGLLLSFEDESGKCWRFRYSYWNSSQSYVLTKGWSRYVKDKRLHAGDVVLFHRHFTHSQRFFINWRRRRTRRHLTTSSDHPIANAVGWTTTRGGFYPYPTHHHPFHPFHAGGGFQQVQGEKEEEASSAGGNSGISSKVLRLFGVNMECQPHHITSTNHSQTFTPESSSSCTSNIINISSPHQQHGVQLPQPSSNHHMLLRQQQPY